MSYIITSRKQIISVLLPHFDKYPLITQKKADYDFFKRVVELMENSEHLTKKGLQDIINIRASHNLGLSEGLKAAFPQTIPVFRPKIENQEIPHPQWVAGFVSGDGCFYVNKSKSTSRLDGYNIRLRFILSQDIRDEQLMASLVTYWNCGRLEKTKEGMVYLSVTKGALFF